MPRNASIREPSSTSDAADSDDTPGDTSAGHDSIPHTKYITELGVPRDEINKKMLSLYEEIGNLSACCDPEFLDGSIATTLFTKPGGRTYRNGHPYTGTPS